MLLAGFFIPVTLEMCFVSVFATIDELLILGNIIAPTLKISLNLLCECQDVPWKGKFARENVAFPQELVSHFMEAESLS